MLHFCRNDWMRMPCSEKQKRTVIAVRFDGDNDWFSFQGKYADFRSDTRRIVISIALQALTTQSHRRIAQHLFGGAPVNAAVCDGAAVCQLA